LQSLVSLPVGERKTVALGRAASAATAVGATRQLKLAATAAAKRRRMGRLLFLGEVEGAAARRAGVRPALPSSSTGGSDA
jgi:hypothetical protein